MYCFKAFIVELLILTTHLFFFYIFFDFRLIYRYKTLYCEHNITNIEENKLGEDPCTNDLICYKPLSPGGRKQSAQNTFCFFFFFNF